ncbi:hypothetical protein [Bacillus marinisedimentorum]|uniref:hypothetical protein n=1 Tax=Bacillus marinisedimentorum TaxID=1821260 RepID=UPI0007DEBD87|nr:hypothetical protein [Bacillus marinisedimentorum]
MGDNKSLLLGAVAGGIVASAATLMAGSTRGEEILENIQKNTTKVFEMIDTIQKEGLSLSKPGGAKIRKKNETAEEIIASIQSMKEQLQPDQQELRSELDKLEGRVSQLVKNENMSFNWTFYFMQKNGNDLWEDRSKKPEPKSITH